MSENLFNQVRGINRLAGNVRAAHIGDLLKQAHIIKNELYEFLQGIADGNLKEIRDGQSDILFTAMGMPDRAGFPYEKDLQVVCDNQFAKFDRSVEDAERTREKYLALNVETEWQQGEYEGVTYYVTRSTKEQLLNGQKIGKGKWLKSWRWDEPEFVTVDIDRTPWVGTEITGEKLAELKAELAVQGYIAKFGAQEVIQILDRAFAPIVEALTGEQAVAITAAMDELDAATIAAAPAHNRHVFEQSKTESVATPETVLNAVPQFNYDSAVAADPTAEDISKGL